MVEARDSVTGPRMKKIVVAWSVIRRPDLVEIGPASRAPKNPPRVYIDEIKPNWEVSMEMHCGRP
jgi:hypothetical protein